MRFIYNRGTVISHIMIPVLVEGMLWIIVSSRT